MEVLQMLSAVLAPIILMWLGWMTNAINRITRETHDLHGWHRPEKGIQEWKNPQIREAIEDLTGELRGMRSDLKDVFMLLKKDCEK